MGIIRSKLLSRTGLRTKLVFWFLLASILPLLMAGYLSYTTIEKQATQSAARDMVTLAQAASRAAQEYLDSRSGDILTWSKFRVIKEALDLAEIREEVCDTLRDMAELSGLYAAIVLVDARNGQCAATSRPDLLDTNFSQDDAFIKAKSGKFEIGEFQHNKMVEQWEPESGGWTVTVAAPVLVQNEVRGVLLAYLRWKALETLILDTKLGKAGYVFVIDTLGTVIVHPDRKLYGVKTSDPALKVPQIEEALQQKRNSVTYEFPDATTSKLIPKIAGIAYMSQLKNKQNLQWRLLATAPAAEVLLLPNILGTLAMILITVIAVVFVLSVILANRISQPITTMAAVARRVADSDLTVDVPKLARTDEIGDLSRAFVSMLESLRIQISQVLRGSDVLKGAVEQISSSVSAVASGAAQVAGSVSETATTLEQLRRSAKISGDKAKSLSDMARRALSASLEGKEATSGTIRGIRSIRDQIDLVGDTVTKLSDQSVSIEQIISTVRDLADQSNLLAVNASIEAARAGDSGKGFSVVAHEIKSLADQSRQSTFQIGEILQNIRNSISAVVASMHQVHEALDFGITQSSRTEESITILNQSVDISSQEATVIETSSYQQNIGMDQVSDAMASIEQAMNQNLGAVRELEDAATKLGQLGNQIRKSVESYRM